MLQCGKLLHTVVNKTTKKYEVLNEDVIYCPKKFVDLAALLDTDPEPYFDSSYNWYYAGNGNIQLLCIDYVDYLLHSEFNILYISQFYKNDLIINKESSVKFDCGNNTNILETIYSENIIALRCKHKVFILKVFVNDVIQIELLKILESEFPYTGINFDPVHKYVLYVTSLDSKLVIVNLNRLVGQEVKLKYKLTSLTNNWGTVMGTHRVAYMHVGGSRITIYDKRTNQVAHKYKHVKNLTDFDCTNISLAKYSEGSTSLYFCTDHHLFLMDARYSSKRKPQVVQRWNHCMKSPPTYASLCDFEFNKELIYLSSQWCEDLCVVANYKQNKQIDMPGVTMPYRPPSVFKVLQEAKERKLCCDIYNPIERRLCTAITGGLVFEGEDKYVLLSQNSLGDILSHVLYPNNLTPAQSDDAAQELENWSKPYTLKQRDFEVSSIIDISKIWKKLKRVPESYKMQESEVLAMKKSQFREREIHEAFESEELDSGLLDIWMKEKIPNTINTEEETGALFFDSDSDDNEIN